MRVQEIDHYYEMQIRNLKYNAAAFAFFSTVTLCALSKVLFPSFDEESLVVELEPIKIEKTVDFDAQNEEIKLENETVFVEQLEYSSMNLVQEEEYSNFTLEHQLENKEYSGMKLSHELEDSIKELSEIYDVPYQIILTIGERESAGNWNNNGVISYSNDYGVFQINECNLGYIEEKLGYTKEEVLYDSVKNTEACMCLVKDILNRDDVDTLEEVFGMYNGWIGWRDKPLAVEYSSACCEIINSYFPDYEYTVSKKY